LTRLAKEGYKRVVISKVDFFFGYNQTRFDQGRGELHFAKFLYGPSQTLQGRARRFQIDYHASGNDIREAVHPLSSRAVRLLYTRNQKNPLLPSDLKFWL